MVRCRRWMDNVFIKHLSHNLKQNDIYLMGYADGRRARAGIVLLIAFRMALLQHVSEHLAGNQPRGCLQYNRLSILLQCSPLPGRHIPI